MISPKSVLGPCTESDFVGKVFSTVRRMIWNKKHMIIALIKGRLRILLGCMTREGMESFLGRLEWALRPHGSTVPFLFGPYKWKWTDSNRVPLLLIGSLLSAVIFAVLPQSLAFPGYVWRGRADSVERNILFVDTAPRQIMRFSSWVFRTANGDTILEVPCLD